MITFGEHEIENLMETIWASILEMNVQPAHHSTHVAGNEHSLTACIQIAGAWKGAVILDCARQLALNVAAAMFAVPPNEATTSQIHDALGELVNMTGGNLKALLPEPCYLSLPVVTNGAEYCVHVLGSQPVIQKAFECNGLPFLVTVVERNDNESESRSHAQPSAQGVTTSASTNGRDERPRCW